MAAAPTAIAAATRHETTNTRIGFLTFLVISSTVAKCELAADRARPYSDVGKGPGFNVYERSSERAHGHVKVSRFSLFEIDKKTPDPGREVLLEKGTICAGLSGNAAADETRHDFTK